MAAGVLREAGQGGGETGETGGVVARLTVALQHPLLREGGLLSPVLASLAQWHLVDNPEQGLGLDLTEALKATLREADSLKRALGQEILTDETKRCMVGLNRLQVVLACLAGKLLGALISGG
ncbi:unnamed protein product, partial [Ectocarpus sp. 8 AP-2014]